MAPLPRLHHHTSAEESNSRAPPPRLDSVNQSAMEPYPRGGPQTQLQIAALGFPPVSENAPIGKVVGVILAAAVNQTIIYSIVEGNEGGEFALHNSTGVITTARRLDFETNSSYVLRVEADPLQVISSNMRAPAKINTARVLIDLRDENDHPPVFTKPLYLGGVTEDAKTFTSILQVQVQGTRKTHFFYQK
ncbi:protocadherin-15-like [Alosa sapidissima]|uniref:protocadherin-15-like n=1 Tax=Alosa sapidissima TaxID=34773 RepID=UPI001C09B22F|nr:protocadherin-15-like [Alosa sapidissima]